MVAVWHGSAGVHEGERKRKKKRYFPTSLLIAACAQGVNTNSICFFCGDGTYVLLDYITNVISIALHPFKSSH